MSRHSRPSRLHEAVIWGLICILIALVGIRASDDFWKQARPDMWFKKADPLDKPLLKFGKDAFTRRDLMNSVLIAGRSGAAKTTGAGRTVFRAIVNDRLSGGIQLAAKPEDVDDTVEMFRRGKRLEELTIINLDGKHRLNFIDDVRAMGGGPREIARFITTVGSACLGANDTDGREDSSFWEREQFNLIHDAIVPVLLATGKVSARDLQKFIATAAYSQQSLDDPTWKDDFHNQIMKRAFDAPKSRLQEQDYELCFDRWFRSFPVQSSRTRSSILTGVDGTLHIFCSGILSAICDADSNIDLEDVFRSRWFLINAAPCEHGEIGRFLSCGIKYLVQRHCLRRKAVPGDGYCVVWSDEAAQFVMPAADGFFLSQCRSHLACMCWLVQSIHAVKDAMRCVNSEARARALLTNFGLKVVHAVGDDQDAAYFSGLCGSALQYTFSGHQQPEQKLFDSFMWGNRSSSGFSEQMMPVIEPRFFMNGLRTGGLKNKMLADAILIRNGEPFGDSRNHKLVTFSQKW